MARLVLGGGCLVVPGWMLGSVGAPDRDDGRVHLIGRVLGARMVVQAALDLAWGRRTRRLGMAVELTHAASMLPVALIWPAHRRAASVSAGLATGIALLDAAEGGRVVGISRIALDVATTRAAFVTEL